MRGTGRRRAGEDNVRLRKELADTRDDNAWYKRRLRDVAARCRAARARAEIAEGQLLLAQQLIHRQTAQLMERDSAIDRLQRQLKADVVRTQPIQVVTEAELTAA
ncbi:MAG: hypothetical protein HOZ81_20130 [Streptomyces sp.]|nr:hypothetical protein [Streptomyces sp.]NUS81850.1 hypothetical protein [Streptomyces sp.]